MYTNPAEAAYCITRIARSNALAAASTDSCARASHVGIARAYGERLTELDYSSEPSTLTDALNLVVEPPAQCDAAVLHVRSLSRWDNEGGALSHDRPPSNIKHVDMGIRSDDELSQLRANVVALENVAVAMLAGGSSNQRAAVHDMALFVRPLLDATPDCTTSVAEKMDQLADRGALFARVLT